MVRIHPDPPTDARPGDGAGAIAQLGERLLCKQEVTGSIPVGSTRIFSNTGKCSVKGPPFTLRFVFRLLFKNSEETRRVRLSQTVGLIWVRDCIKTRLRLSRLQLHQAQRETCGGVPCSKGAMPTVIGSSE